MTTTTPDPITTNTERVLVRNTVTGFEQGIAATAGFFTAGPIGALASWGAIRGVQGKWTPWFILGVPAAIGINVVNVALLATLGAVMAPDSDTPSFGPSTGSDVSQLDALIDSAPDNKPEIDYPTIAPEVATPAVNPTSQTCFTTAFPGSNGDDSKAFGCDVTNPEPGIVNVKWSDGITSTFVNHTGPNDEIIVGSSRNTGTIDYVWFEGKKYLHFTSDKGSENWIPTDTFQF